MNLLLFAKDKHDTWRLSSVMCQMAYFATGEVSLSHVSHLKGCFLTIVFACIYLTGMCSSESSTFWKHHVADCFFFTTIAEAEVTLLQACQMCSARNDS